jgi:iron complex outermembrane recepter protein
LTAIPVSRGYTYYASMDATRDFSIWRTRHSLLAGIDFFQTGAYSVSDLSSDFSLTTDLFHPHNVPVPVTLLGNPDLETSRNARERWEAAYLQDQVSLGGALYLLVGVRFDAAFVSISNEDKILTSVGQPYFEEGQQVHAVKQREGLVWHPLPWWSLYAKYTENFGATPGLYVPTSGASTILIPAQSATEWEAGVKLETADGRAAATLAVFDLTKKNISSPPLEPALDPQGLLYLTGTARNLGLEIDFHGEILPGLQALANYTYIASRIIDGTGNNPISTNGGEFVGNTGDRLFGVARNGGSAWGAYRFAGGVLNGLKFGAGVIVRGGREGDNLNDYGLPGFTRWNTFVSYNWHVKGMVMSAEANIDNLFNARYFESLSGTHTVVPASPRRWMASLRVDF